MRRVALATGALWLAAGFFAGPALAEVGLGDQATTVVGGTIEQVQATTAPGTAELGEVALPADSALPEQETLAPTTQSATAPITEATRDAAAPLLAQPDQVVTAVVTASQAEIETAELTAAPVVASARQALAPVGTTVQDVTFAATPTLATVGEATAPALAAVEPLGDATALLETTVEPGQQLTAPIVAISAPGLQATQRALDLAAPVSDVAAAVDATAQPSGAGVVSDILPATFAPPTTPAPAESPVAGPRSPSDRRTGAAAAGGSTVAPATLPSWPAGAAPITEAGTATLAAKPGAPAPSTPRGLLGVLSAAFASGFGGSGFFVILLAALAAGFHLAAPGLGRRLRPTVAPWRLPTFHLSLERPG